MDDTLIVSHSSESNIFASPLAITLKKLSWTHSPTFFNTRKLNFELMSILISKLTFKYLYIPSEPQMVIPVSLGFLFSVFSFICWVLCTAICLFIHNYDGNLLLISSIHKITGHNQEFLKCFFFSTFNCIFSMDV